MKKNYLVLFAFLLQLTFLFAQNRYLDPMFGVQRTPNVDYGKNIGIITGAPAQENFKVDI